MSDAPDLPPNWIADWIEEQRLRLEKSGLAGISDPFSSWLAAFQPAAHSTPEAGKPHPDQPFAAFFPHGLPALGWSREYLEAWQAWAEAQRTYGEAAAAFDAVVKRVHLDALTRLQQVAQERSMAGARLETARELYDVWIQCGEQAFAQVAPQEYARAQADLSNAMVALRARQQRLVELFSRQLDLPTRAEINTLNRQLRELRERVDGLQSARSTAASAKRSSSRGKHSA